MTQCPQQVSQSGRETSQDLHMTPCSRMGLGFSVRPSFRSECADQERSLTYRCKFLTMKQQVGFRSFVSLLMSLLPGSDPQPVPHFHTNEWSCHEPTCPRYTGLAMVCPSTHNSNRVVIPLTNNAYDTLVIIFHFFLPTEVYAFSSLWWEVCQRRRKPACHFLCSSLQMSYHQMLWAM